MNWLEKDRNDLAAERILDAAAQLFVERGVATVGMADIARRAGCSRATMYRYFDSRRSLQLAFVHREARRVGETILAETSTIPDLRERTVAAMLAAVREVRADPTMIAWFQLGDAGLASEIAHSSEVIEGLSAAFFDGNVLLAKWTVRIIVSLLTVPGSDDAEERAMLELFVAPSIDPSQLDSVE
ncbi:TetR/AcrR family transcriptional regulator [Antrihabitans sp. YC2-6]|uniref:TetR/AcrR family transcriptional regulator n=1 Tax=Antrihabitans sp. YC2-6 TaxID=2799498 RepID=UPI0018F62490|nr:TetR/AcrR family transcriptional regulator [Antrihabitans sp. YC2-6]MBJ8344945.1 TetR/AcrR family transcriptional regulator [Antrihabitans sp. YC2-6]